MRHWKLLLLFVGLASCFAIYLFMSNRSITSFANSVSRLHITNTYTIITIKDELAEQSEGITHVEIPLTSKQFSTLELEAKSKGYKPCPLPPLPNMTFVPDKIAQIKRGLYKISMGNPDERDIELVVLDSLNQKLIIYVSIL